MITGTILKLKAPSMLDFSSAEHAVRASGPRVCICLDSKQMGVSVRHLESHACHCTPLPRILKSVWLPE